MEKYFLFKYAVGDKKYTVKSDKAIENEDLSLYCDTELTEIKIVPHKKLSDIALEISYPLQVSSDTYVYCNGFQSWSYSREYTLKERYDSIPVLLRPMLKAMGATNIGDESFAPQPRKKGVFKSSGHFYMRRLKSDNIDLMGSTNENIGYTSFVIDCNNSTVTAVKDLQGLVLDSETMLYKIIKLSGDYNTAWDSYFSACGVVAPQAPPLKGYSSWYNNYRNITETTILRDLQGITAVAGDRINIFQIDDGYQPAIGDLTEIDKTKFPNGLKPIVDKIHDCSLQAGLWMCPFGATKKSKLYKEHNDWIVKNLKGKPIKAGIAWGGFYAIDIYNADAREYIKQSIQTVVVDWGFDLLKLDFLYCAAIQPRNGKTRAMIMCDAIDLLRESAAETPIIGCGVPIAPSYNRFEYMRIGADCSFGWGNVIDGASPEMLSTRKTTQNMLYRRYYDKRVFLNDPDVFYLRESNIKMSNSKKLLHAELCKLSGSVLLTSDVVSEYGEKQKQRFIAIIEEPRYNINSVERANRYVRVNYGDNNSHIIFNAKNGNTINKKLNNK